MSYSFCFIFIISSFATLASDELLVHLKLKNYINDISNFSETFKAAKCGDTYNPNCPDVHVSKWCQEQDEILKIAPLKKRPQQVSKEKSILFLAEEHGDENAYDYYEKLIAKKEFDCLFLELPSVFQKNIDHRKVLSTNVRHSQI